MFIVENPYGGGYVIRRLCTTIQQWVYLFERRGDRLGPLRVFDKVEDAEAHRLNERTDWFA